MQEGENRTIYDVNRFIKAALIWRSIIEVTSFFVYIFTPNIENSNDYQFPSDLNARIP